MVLSAIETRFLAQAKWRISICHEQEGIRLDTQAPPPHPNNEVEEYPRVSPCHEDGEPSEHHGKKCDEYQHRQDEVVRDCQKSFDQRQPPIQLVFYVWIVDL
jgi:hypothetical protein